jgi:hypothetical protein
MLDVLIRVFKTWQMAAGTFNTLNFRQVIASTDIGISFSQHGSLKHEWSACSVVHRASIQVMALLCLAMHLLHILLQLI